MVMAYMVMAYMVMAYIVMAYMVMALYGYGRIYGYGVRPEQRSEQQQQPLAVAIAHQRWQPPAAITSENRHVSQIRNKH